MSQLGGENDLKLSSSFLNLLCRTLRNRCNRIFSIPCDDHTRRDKIFCCPL